MVKNYAVMAFLGALMGGIIPYVLGFMNGWRDSSIKTLESLNRILQEVKKISSKGEVFHIDEQKRM